MVLADDRSVIAEQQQVQARRDYQFDEDEVLGRESEEDLLREQMNKQLVQSVLRRLSFIK
jgi:LPS-assembly lipoprotein